MLKTAFIAMLALVCVASSAQACIPTNDVMRPCAYEADFLKGVRSIKVRMERVRRHRVKTSRKALSEFRQRNNFNGLAIADGLSRPLRYIRGRLVCARNVNLALAERGIQGTGSALAHSFDHWGVRVPIPVVGAVAVTDRRGGGHVALISRVEGSRVFAWNPSARGRGWREVEYTHRHARYRVAG